MLLEKWAAHRRSDKKTQRAGWVFRSEIDPDAQCRLSNSGFVPRLRQNERIARRSGIGPESICHKPSAKTSRTRNLLELDYKP
jgi:hypothetical protein